MHRIAGWNAADDNAPAIPAGASWPGRWIEQARAFRGILESRGRLGFSHATATGAG